MGKYKAQWHILLVIEIQLKKYSKILQIKAHNINNMDIQAKYDHYIHTIEHPHSQRSIIKPFHKYENGHTLQVAIVNHNTIQVYKNVGSSLIYDKTYYFMCDITIMEVIPLKGNNTDILFLADELGRFMFWSPTQGVISANNQTRSNDNQAPFYQRPSAEQKQQQFSGIHYYFNILDTEAVIFFTVSTKIVVLKIRWTKGKVLFLSPPQQITFPYLDINFIGIIRGKDPFIGIIQQKEQKTFLRFHKINSQNFQCVTSLQKSNLDSFYSGFEGQEIILVTNSELSIFNMKNQQIFCSFQISEAGYVCAIDNQLYLYVGQLGSQMIIFSKKHYKNYGSFMLQNQVCMRLSYICKLPDESFLVGVIDQGHTVQFIALHEQSWRSIRSIFSTCSIFNIEDLQRPNQCMAIVRVGQNMHQIGVLSKHLTSKLQKQSSMKSPILGLFCTNNGKAIILSSYESNSVLIYSEENECFEAGFEFQLGVIVKVIDKFIIMENKVYQMDLNNNKNNIKEILVEKSGIISADFDGKFLGYQTKESDFKFFNTQTKQHDRIRKYCFQEYIWKFYSSEILVAGTFNQPGHLKIIPIFKQASLVKIQCSDIISDIACQDEFVIISFANCRIEIYEFAEMKIISTIDCSSEPLQLLQWKNNFIAYGTNQCYLINPSLKTYQQVQFDPSKEIIHMAYLQSYNKFVIAHQQSLALYSIKTDRPEQASSFRVVSMNVDSNPPYSTVKNGRLYVAQNYEVIMRNINTAQLLKKQSHGLKQISAIQKLESGLIVCGMNDMDCAQIFLFNYKDLEIIFTDSLHKSDALDKRTPSAVIKKSANSFFIREDNYLTLFQIVNNNLKQIFSSKIGINGYTLAIQPEISMIMASDPLRYLVVYDYRLGKLISLCRYQGLNTINDVEFLEHSVIAGDSAGNITIVQFNFDKNQAARTQMTEVASIKTGSEIIRLTKGVQGVVYSTISGSVGRLKAINFQNFTTLKKIQKQVLTVIQEKNNLRYQQWVNRSTLGDKLIDGFLIDYYLSNEKVKDKNYHEIQKLWEFLKSKK